MGYLLNTMKKSASAAETSAQEKLDTLKAIGGGAAGAATGAYGTALLGSVLEDAKLKAVTESKPYKRLLSREGKLINQLAPASRMAPELSAKRLLEMSPDAMKNEIKVVAALDKLNRVKARMHAKGKLGTAANLGLAGLGLASSAGLGALGVHLATGE